MRAPDFLPDPFARDERAVSPVIGAVLMLAVAMLLVTVLQTTAIPSMNAQQEFQHNQDVQTELVTLGGAVDRVAVRDAGESLTVPLGLRFPPRLLFVNPPPVSGRLETTDAGTVTIQNAQATGETGDYWDGSPRTFTTRTAVYTPAYYEYGQAPVTVVEPWAVYNRDRGQTRPQTATDLVDGRRISLVTLQGEYTQEAPGAVGVTVTPASGPVRTVTVANEGSPITLTVPTELRRDAWRDLLADELDPDGTNPNRYVQEIACAQAPPEPCGELTLTLEPGQYELALGSASLGTTARRSAPEYVTVPETIDPSVPDTGTVTVTVEVRDAYDNPVSGVEVAFATADGRLDAGTARTDEAGRATVQFTPAGAGTATVTARADVDGSGTVEADEEVAVTVDVFSTAGGGGGGGGDGGVGVGGTEEYNLSDTRRTIADEGGLWRGLTGVQRLVFSSPRFAPTEAGQHEELKIDQRHFRMVYGIKTGSVTYYVAFTETPQGLYYQPSSGTWSNTQVTILREEAGTTTSVSAALDPAVLTEWRSASGTPINVLSVRPYTTATSPAFRERLTEIGQALRTSSSELFVTEMHGRVTVDASQRGQSLAYPDVFRDGDGVGEPQESTAIPPGTPAGNLNSFARMQQIADGDETQLVEQNRVEGMAIGTATYGVDQTGTTYTLEVRFRYDKGGGLRAGGTDNVAVEIVNRQGTVLQTATLDRESANAREQQITLNEAARTAVQQSGNLYVVYRQGANGVETDLRIDYQRLRVT